MRNENRLPNIQILALIYIAGAASMLYLKKAFMEQGGYRIASRLTAQDESALPLLYKLHFFSADILLLLVAIPLILWLIKKVLSAKACARTVLAISLFLVILSFVNLNALGSTGKFISADQLRPIFIWVLERPDTVFEYVSPHALVKLALLLSVIFLLYQLSWKASLFGWMIRPFLIGLLSAGCGAASAIAVYTDEYPGISLHSSVTIDALKEFALPPDFSDAPEFRSAAYTDVDYHCGRHDAYPERAVSVTRKPNIVLLILETFPQEVYEQAEKGSLKNFSSLKKSALISLNHFSTYPYSSDARFSIFTGLYPSNRIEKTLPVGSPFRFRSAFSELVEEGYEFIAFDPVVKRFPVDDWVIEQMGGRVESATNKTGDIVERDDDVLQKMLAAIRSRARSGTPFVYAYLPQITHGPWLAPGTSKGKLYAEGEKRIRKLDVDIGRLVATLKENAVYDNTIIVITGDHGLRTRKEAGHLKATVLDSLSYHVPFILHDPALKGTVEVTALTSHVDISPTIQCLYSGRKNAIVSQGMEMSQASERNGPIFFGGGWYMGSDGVWTNGAFYSFNRQLDLLWKSDRFEFDESRPLQPDRIDRSVVRLLNHQLRFQEKLLSMSLPEMLHSASLSDSPIVRD